MRQFMAEVKKTRYRKIWQGMLAIMAVQLVWCAWIFSRADAGELASGYYYAFLQVVIMNSIFLPVILAVAASRIWDAEHKGNTWKLLGTLETKAAIYRSKFLLGALYCLMMTAMQTVMLVLCANIFHFTQEMPVKHMVWFFVTVMAVDLMLYLVQQILSMKYPNQLVALSVGLLGAFGGLFSYFFPAGLQKLVIWGYYGVLRSVDMYWDEATRISTYFERPMDYGFLAFVILLTVVLYWVGRQLFIREEYAS